jgi:hypothetical protein
MDPSEMASRTIFRSHAVLVSAPFVDGAPVESRYLACHGSLEAALSWIRGGHSRTGLALDEATEHLLFIRVTETALDVGPSDYRGDLMLSAAGEALARCPDSGDEPWLGRAAACRQWQRGDVVACVDQGCYRVGVVLALPPSLEWVRKAGGEASRSDDVYLLAFTEDDFSHAHPHEALMFEPLAEVPKELLLRLERRLQIYPGVGGGGWGGLAPDSASTRPRVRQPRASPPRDTALRTSKRERQFPVCCLQSDAGFILCSIPPRSSGVDGVVWFSEGEFLRHPSAHGPRILVLPGERRPGEGLKRAVQVRLTSPPEALGTLPNRVAQQVATFVEKNRVVLSRYWKGGMGTDEVYKLLERV